LGALLAVGAGWTLLTTQWFSEQFPTSTTIDIDAELEDIRNGIGSLSSTGSMQGGEKYNAVFELLKNQYYHKEDLDQVKMQENALKGFVDAL